MKNRISTIAAACCVILASSCASNHDGLRVVQPKKLGMDFAKLSQIDSVVNRAIEEGTIPGAVVSVVRGKKIAYLKAYGNKQVVPDTVRMTPNTMFDLASLSKCVGTTLSFMQLIENGQVRLHDNVDRYIPDFKPYVDPETGETVDIEVIDLLTHVSGLPPYLGVDAFCARFGENQPDSLMRVIATEQPRNYRPKHGHAYSCLNFVTVQNILQNVTGEKLCDYAYEHVFSPLGLQHTCYLPQGEMLELVAPTEVQADGKPLLGAVHDPLARRCNGGNSGNAGVFSNAQDLSVIAAALMNGGALGRRRILSPMTIKMMAHVPEENEPWIGCALGWDNNSDAAGLTGDIFSRAHTICHTGYTGTSMVVDLDSKTAVIILTNRVHPEDKGGLGRVRATIANIVSGSIVKPLKK